MIKLFGLSLQLKIFYWLVAIAPVVLFFSLGAVSEKLKVIDSWIFLMVYVIFLMFLIFVILLDYTLYFDKNTNSIIVKNMVRKITISRNTDWRVKEIPLLSIWGVFLFQVNGKSYLFHKNGVRSFKDLFKSNQSKEIEQVISEYFSV